MSKENFAFLLTLFNNHLIQIKFIKHNIYNQTIFLCFIYKTYLFDIKITKNNQENLMKMRGFHV